MARRLLLWISLLANLVLAGGWYVSMRATHQRLRQAIASAEVTNTPPVKTRVEVRRQFFSWQQVESDDYPTYIANLREIGCPEQTIRDIIIADVNALYARRAATEIVTPEQQWWRAEPDTNVLQAAAARLRALDQERRQLLTALLGPNWEGGDLISLPRPSRTGVVLDGPILGNLPNDVKQAVQEIALQSQERLQAYLDARREAGQEPDPAELVRLRRQTREQLARVLTPPQLEEYLLRYSQTANDLRRELARLQFFEATPEEFRALFRAVDSIEEQLQLLAGQTDFQSTQTREALERQKQTQLRNALGEARYREFQLLQDPLYRQAVATARELGLTNQVMTLYEINQLAAQQRASVNANTNLTDTQRAIELKRLELEQLKAQALLSGQELPPSEKPAPPAPPPMRKHQIVFGDNLGTVSLTYGVTISAIRAANPGVDFTKLQPGDVINIPAASAPPPPPLPPFPTP